MTRLLAALALVAALIAPARAQEFGDLVASLNALRTQPATCEGKPVPGAPPLAPSVPLSRAAGVLAQNGGQIDAALGQAGYRSRRSFSLGITGGLSGDALARYAGSAFCASLHSTEVSEIGIAKSGNRLTILLAQPMTLPGAAAADEDRNARRVLDLVNQARGEPRRCGNRAFAAAPPLAWDATLAAASLAYAQDLAQYRYLSHTGRDGSTPGDRATRAGYVWKAVGENIAAGQTTPEEVTAGWLASPEHCANIMSPAFRMMGAAYALNPADRMAVYWAQLFAAPR